MKLWIISAIIALVAWNIFVFFLYGADKRKARKGHWRISESTLLASAFCMGGLGTVLGMKTFHHKTKHSEFKILVPIALALNAAAIAAAIYFACI
ncbi:MAG: DUF1294 domain-containing protein [Oscillospiraceae bacterium]